MSQSAPSTLACDTSSDSHLANRVRNFLLSKVMPGRGQLDVAADGDVVTLRGRVGSFYHKQLAQEVARSLAANVEVINLVSVCSEQERVQKASQ